MSMLDQYDADGVVVVHDRVRGPAEGIAESESGIFDFNTGSESFVQQSYIEECDINNIVRKYMDVGAPNDHREPLYGDFSSIPDYQDAFDIVRQASDSFASLPSDVRTRFGNDPGLMMAFLADPANNEESYKLGLRVKPEPSDADRIVEAISASSAPAAAAPPT